MRQKAQWFLESCREVGISIIISCTFRTLQEQAILFRRSKSGHQVEAKIQQFLKNGYESLAMALREVGPQVTGPRLTSAAPGESPHNYGLAFDFYPLIGGKLAKETAVEWKACGQIASNLGLEWGGSWSKRNIDRPHVQTLNFDYRSHIIRYKTTPK